MVSVSAAASRGAAKPWAPGRNSGSAPVQAPACCTAACCGPCCCGPCGNGACW
ncbi:hypothetical protein GXW82_34990 [Streptacidiphilus sp. 4-A2]|nr:hypothetical protein [Streptacidiphilus sp. 4-A2]